jgi:hypothetical protein
MLGRAAFEPTLSRSLPDTNTKPSQSILVCRGNCCYLGELTIMGSSNRKKKEKAQDFKKTKLKVGKARPKNTNATNTSFAAKGMCTCSRYGDA